MKKPTTALRNFLSTTNHLIQSHDFLHRHRIKENAFTRNRKMSFTSIVKFIISLPQKSLDISLDHFLDAPPYAKLSTYTKQAFSKQRQLISFEAFRELFHLSARFQSPVDRRFWHGHSIYAIDGTTVQVPNTKTNRDYFGFSDNHHYESPLAMARVSALYNVLHDRIADVVIDSYFTHERYEAYDLIENFVHEQSPRQPIMLMDRGYPSREMFYRLLDKNWHFVIRFPKNSLQSINDLPEGDHFVYDYFRNFPLLLRVIKVTLANGMEETLVTNLYEKKYTVPMFLELYFMRWGIETKYCEVKSRLNIENFTGRKPETILQDFYATLFVSNIVSMFKEVVDQRIQETNQKKTLKYEYQANRNYLIGCITKHLLDIIQFSRKRKKLLDMIIERSFMHRSEVRPNRSSERHIKHPTSKYTTSYKNSI